MEGTKLQVQATLKVRGQVARQRPKLPLCKCGVKHLAKTPPHLTSD